MTLIFLKTEIAIHNKLLFLINWIISICQSYFGFFFFFFLGGWCGVSCTRVEKHHETLLLKGKESERSFDQNFIWMQRDQV